MVMNEWMNDGGEKVTKVFLGAYALVSNGQLISRAGTALVAMMGSSLNIPVLVCCESYKFADRARLDSICFNELGNPDALLSDSDDSPNLLSWRHNKNLKLVNLSYDLTPMDFITGVISEFGLIPPTSVPVILNEFLEISASN